MIDPTLIPDKMKRLMTPKDRAKLGDLARTESEVKEDAIHACEKEMQGQIKKWLGRHGWHYDWQRMDKRTRGKLGQPDFSICIKGRYVAIECKMPGKKLSPEQLLAMMRIVNSGGLHRVVYSAKEAREFLKGLTE